MCHLLTQFFINFNSKELKQKGKQYQCFAIGHVGESSFYLHAFAIFDMPSYVKKSLYDPKIQDVIDETDDDFLNQCLPNPIPKFVNLKFYTVMLISGG